MNRNSTVHNFKLNKMINKLNKFFRKMIVVFLIVFLCILEIFQTMESVFAADGMNIYPLINTGYISREVDASVDKSVKIVRIIDITTNTIHWQITFNPGQEVWSGGSKVYVWLPTHNNTLSVKETVKLNNGKPDVVTTYPESIFGTTLTESNGNTWNSYKYNYGSTNFNTEYTNRLQATENNVNMSDVNWWKDQGRFSDVIVKDNGLLNTAISNRNITIWEFDTVHNPETNLNTVPIIAGFTRSDHEYPRFIAQGPFAPEVTINQVTSNPNATIGDSYYTQAKTVTITGTGTPSSLGATLTLTYGNGQTATATIDNSGKWTTTLTGIDVGSNVTATVSKIVQGNTYRAQASTIVSDATKPGITTPNGLNIYTVGDTFPDLWNLENGTANGDGARENVEIKDVKLTFDGQIVTANDSQRLASITDLSSGITFQVADRDNVNKNGQSGGNDKFVATIGFKGKANKVGFFKANWTVTDLAGNYSSATQTIKVNPVTIGTVAVASDTLTESEKNIIKEYISNSNGITNDPNYIVVVGSTVSNGKVFVTITQKGYETQPFTVEVPVVINTESVIPTNPDNPETPIGYILVKFNKGDNGTLTGTGTSGSVTGHVETCVLLSHKSADDFISVKMEYADDRKIQPDRITYRLIQEYIEEKYGFKVHTANIAEVKRNLGLPMYDAPNAVEELKRPYKPAPEYKVEAIKDALRHFKVID